MSKVIIFLCIAFLAFGMIVAQEPICKPGGVVCSSDTECCVGLVCNPWAGRCTKPKVTTTTAGPTGESSGEENAAGENPAGEQN